MRWTRTKLICALSWLFSLSAMALVVFTRYPLGIPGEWTWIRRPIQALPVMDFAIAGVGFLFLGILVYLCDKKLTATRDKCVALVLILLLGGWLDYFLLLSGFFGSYESVMTIRDKWSTGYLTEALTVHQPLEYARTLHHKLALDAEKSNHLDVHPAGHVLFAKTMLAVTEKGWIPAWLRNAILTPDTVERGRRTWLTTIGHAPNDDLLFRTAENMMVVFLLMAIVARFMLVASLLVLNWDFQKMGLVAGLLCLISFGPVLFLGHYDIMLFFFSSILALLWCCTRRWKKWENLLLFCCGIGIAMAAQFSLAYLAFGPLLLLGYLLESRFAWRRCVLSFGSVLLGGLFFMGMLELLQIRVFAQDFYAWRNNGRFFAESGRSCVAWWPWNLTDLFLFSGALWCLSLFSRMGVAIGSWKQKIAADDCWRLALGAVVLFLCISQFSRGEMGRLFLFLMPPLLLAGCQDLRKSEFRHTEDVFYFVGGCQAYLLALTLRVNLALMTNFWSN